MNDETDVTQQAPEGVESQQTTEQAAPETLLDALTDGLGVKDDGYVRDEAGRFARKPEDDAAPPETGVKPPDATQEKKPPEADEFSMPEGLSQKSQDRFRSLVSRVQEKQAIVDRMQADIEGFRQVISETGASAQEFAQALDYMKMVKHGDLDGALRILDDQRRQISLALGRPLPGADPLQAFPDLRQRVDAYQMDEHAALEIARMRAYQQQLHDSQQHQRAFQQQQAEAAQSRNQAISQIDRMGMTWAKTDPDYATKEAVILKQLPVIAQNYPPQMWAQQVGLLYETLSSMPMPASTRAAGPAPLRPSGQSAGARQPTSMLEALEAGLGYSNG